MKNILSEMIITRIHAFNRVNVPSNSSSGFSHPRERSALAIKTEGLTEYKSGNIRLKSDSTSAVLLPKGSMYSWVCLQKGECLMIEFDGINIPENPVAIKMKNLSEITGIFTKLEKIMIFKKNAYTIKCMQGVYEILVKLSDADNADYGLTSKKNKISESVSYLENNCLSSNVSVEYLAELSGVSSVYFRKIFTEIYGISPIQYVNKIRIEKAKGLLWGDYGSVTEISELCGFGSVYHFCKVFKKACGITPTEWAKKTGLN